MRMTFLLGRYMNRRRNNVGQIIHYLSTIGMNEIML
jgi:hypothetical protein